jgi:hypothetical protein
MNRNMNRNMNRLKLEHEQAKKVVETFENLLSNAI